MKISKSTKYIIIILICSALDFIAHGITSAVAPFNELSSPSIISRYVGTTGAAFIWILLAFSIVALWYYRYEKKLAGDKINRGIKLGLSAAVIWFIGMIESAVMSDSTRFMAESVMGLCDAAPVVILGMLLDRFTESRSRTHNIYNMKSHKTIFDKNNIICVIIFASIFVVIRYIFYSSKLIDSGYLIKIGPTFVWTVCMGAYIGIFYLLLGRCLKGRTIFLKSREFSFVLFGMPWFIFLSFIPIVFDGSMTDVVLRCLCDGFSTFLACYLCEIYLANKQISK